MGHFAVSQRDGVLAAIGLGSCVAVILYDPEVRLGALLHVLLPSHSLSRQQDNPARAADTAVPVLIEAMIAHGADPDRLMARLVGGSTMFADLMPSGAVHIGERNVVACRAGLRDAGVPIVGESVGGKRGRSVWFDVARNVVTVRSVGDEPQVL